MPLHPLIRTLHNVNLTSMSRQEVATVFNSAGEAGLTPTEQRVLSQVGAHFSSGWDPGVRSDWQARMSNTSTGVERVTPYRGGAASPEDLSATVRKIWMSDAGDPIQRAYMADMIKLADKYGYKMLIKAGPHVSISELASDLMRRTGLSLDGLRQRVDVVRTQQMVSDWGEDRKIVTSPEGIERRINVLIPASVSYEALDRAMLFTAKEGYHPFDPESFQGAVAGRQEDAAARDIARRLGRPVRTMKTYLEGGNILAGTTSEGKPYALVGRDSLIISAYALDEKGAFRRRDVDAKLQEMRSNGTLNQQEVWDTARKMLETESQMSRRLPWMTQQQLLADAERFVAKVELTKKLIADDLGVKDDRVVFVTQPDFHIDMHMRPMAHGEVLVNHPAKNIELVDEALRDPALQPWERQELQQMRQHAQWELQNMGHVYNQIISELQHAGLLVVPSPGVFQSRYRQANFMNGVPGTTENGDTFYVVNASSIKPLERAFARHANSVGVKDVSFVGGEGGGANSLSASEYSLELAGGLDCRGIDHGGNPAQVVNLLDQLRVA